MMKIQLHSYDILSSTNETAVVLAADGAPEGSIVVAERQDGGHGRMQRIWSSPKGGLWFSIILRPSIDPQFAAQITLLAGVAVAKAIRRLYNTDKACIKWPNDLLWEDKKICGILSELQLTPMGEIDYAVVGIGINVASRLEEYPEELRSNVAVLNTLADRDLTCDSVREAVVEEFIPLYEHWQIYGAEELLTEWQELNCTLGRNVNVKDDDIIVFSGVAETIDSTGALSVRSETGELRTYDFGEISIR